MNLSLVEGENYSGSKYFPLNPDDNNMCPSHYVFFGPAKLNPTRKKPKGYFHIFSKREREEKILFLLDRLDPPIASPPPVYH